MCLVFCHRYNGQQSNWTKLLLRRDPQLGDTSAQTQGFTSGFLRKETEEGSITDWNKVVVLNWIRCEFQVQWNMFHIVSRIRSWWTFVIKPMLHGAPIWFNQVPMISMPSSHGLQFPWFCIPPLFEICKLWKVVAQTRKHRSFDLVLDTSTPFQLSLSTPAFGLIVSDCSVIDPSSDALCF